MHNHHASTKPISLVAAALILLLAACGGTPASAPPAATATQAAAATEIATLAPTATPQVPADAAPPELQGKWEVVIGTGETATLRIGETTYLVSRGGNPVGGRISVAGQQITFKDSSACEGGIGVYTWAITNGVLTFTPTGEPDPCPRKEYLIGTTLTRA